jgi:hypothetical protein
MPTRYLLPALFIWACTHGGAARPQLAEAPAPPERHRLVAADLSVWRTVDTTDAAAQADVACLQRFFEHKLDSGAAQDFWWPQDLDTYVRPYEDLLYTEYDSEARLRYLPTLMERRPLPDGTRLLRVKWAAPDSTGKQEEVRQVFGFVVRDTPEGPRLAMPLENNTATWERQQVGPITYIVSPQRRFDPAVARAQQQDVEALGRFFGIAPFPITYYSFKDPAELFRARGFELYPAMYAHATGGRLDHGGQVYAGNNSERYTHEIVHAFIFRSLGRSGMDLLHEGLATWLGGSNEHPYVWHRAQLQRLLAEEPDRDLRQDLNVYDSDYYADETNVAYTLGALVVEHIVRTGGKEAPASPAGRLFALFAEEHADLSALEKYGIREAEMNRWVREALAKEPLLFTP